MVEIVTEISGSTFSIDADTRETVLGVKRKIEMSQGIPVSNQMIFFNSTLLEEDLDLNHYKIVKKSRLHLFVPHNDQVLHQTGQSPEPSKSMTEISNTEDSPEKIIQNQGSTLIARSNNDQVLQQTRQPPVHSHSFGEFFNNQDSTVTGRSNDGDQVLNQTVKPPLTSDEIDEILSWPLLTAEDIRNIQETWRRSSQERMETSPPSSLNGDFVYGDDRPLSAEEIRIMQGNVNVQDFLQGEPSPPSNLVGDHFMYGDDRPLLTEEIRILQGNVKFQDLLQGEPSPPSNLIGEFMYGDDRPLLDEEIRILQGNFNVQDSSSYYQDLLLRESSPPSDLVGDHFMYGGDKPLSTEHVSNSQYYLPESTTEQNRNQMFQTEQSQPSNSTEQRINTQDVTVNVGSSNQMLQTPPVKMVRRAPKYPRKMRLMILPYSGESKAVEKFPVFVNPFENVQELRKDLEEIQQRTDINLPEKGYLFIHKQRVLEEDQSFWGNNVVPGDTIEIFPGSKDGRVRKPGH